MPRHAASYVAPSYGPFEIDRARPVADQVYAALRRKILEVELAPGDPVAEQDVALATGVSRTPVRQAIRQLVDEKLVVVYPSLGTFVAEIDAGAVEQAVWIRHHLEPEIAADCAGRTDRRDLTDAMSRHLEAHEAALSEGRHDEAYTCDGRFHRSMSRFLRRDLVWSVIRLARTQMHRVHALSRRREESLTAAVNHHRAILAAIEAGNVEGARRAMRDHMAFNRQIASDATLTDPLDRRRSGQAKGSDPL